MNNHCDCFACRWTHEVVLFVLFLLMSGLLACAPTYQVMDGKRVPRHPSDTVAAQFPIQPPADTVRRKP